MVDQSAHNDTSIPIDVFEPVFARTIKITVPGAGSYGGPWVSIFELQTFGDAPTPCEIGRHTREWGAMPDDSLGPDEDPDEDGVRNFFREGLGRGSRCFGRGSRIGG